VSRLSVPPKASTAAPSRTPADVPPSLPDGCSRYTDSIYAHPTRTASLANLHSDAVRLLNRRERHGMCRCCDEQGKSYSRQPNHLLFSMLQLSGYVAIPIKIDRPMGQRTQKLCARVHRRRRIQVRYQSQVLGRKNCGAASDARSLSIKTGSGLNPRKRTWVTSSYLRQYPRLVANTYHAAEMLARSFIVTIGYSDATSKFCN